MGVLTGTAAVLRQFGVVGEVAARAVELSGDGLQATEKVVWSFVRQRMEAVAPVSAPPRELESTRPNPRSEPVRSPRELMTELLGDALAHDSVSSEREYLTAVVRQLLPDEARIIAALAAGVSAPTVSIYRRGSSELLLENASLIGRTAAVTLPSRTLRYVAHLLQLGLVELGPEDKSDETGYELILADRDVRPALREGSLGKLPARIERRTLRLSRHGEALWEATRPDATEGPS